MFEFVIKVGENLGNHEIYNGNEYYEDKSYKRYEQTGDKFHLIGLYRGDKNKCVYEDADNILLIVGSVFFQDKISPCSKALSPQEIFNYLEEDKDFLQKIKGDFNIIKFSKTDLSIKIINDQFALRPLYYGEIADVLIFTNNLNVYKSYNPELNEVVILEKILFSYPLTRESFFKGVYFLDGGEIVTYKNNKVEISNYFSLENFVFSGSNRRFDYKKFVRLFNNSVLQKARLTENITSSLTGGFDGRGIASVLLKEGCKFKTYSFGKKNGENTKVPIEISKKINVNYEPVYLEEDYKEKYFKYAKEAIYFSDGLSFNERANYTYTFHKLSKNTSHILSGLVAGEILRPIHLRTDYMNEFYYQVFYLDNQIEISEYLSDKKIYPYISKDFIQRNTQELLRRIKLKRIQIKTNKKRTNGYLYYYYDLIRLGFRRFYGSEMHLERFYCTTQAPYFDYDILSYILNSDYKKVFKNCFKDSLIFRWKGQKIYAHIFKNNFPLLGKIPVDRGYKPEYLLSPVRRLLIIYLFLKRRKRVKKSNPEFDSPTWTGIFLKGINLDNLEDSFLSNLSDLNGYIDKYRRKKYNKEMNKLLAISYWLKN